MKLMSKKQKKNFVVSIPEVVDIIGDSGHYKTAKVDEGMVDLS